MIKFTLVVANCAYEASRSDNSDPQGREEEDYMLAREAMHYGFLKNPDVAVLKAFFDQGWGSNAEIIEQVNAAVAKEYNLHRPTLLSKYVSHYGFPTWQCIRKKLIRS